MPPRLLRLAATALPMRPIDGGFEVLMVRRNTDLSFGGMWTFPGGVVEAADGPVPEEIDELGQDWFDDRLTATARAAAARETREETALVCRVDSMTLFSHWIPPDAGGPPKRFATWFFLAPEVSGELVVDATENSDARWVRPRAALDDYADDAFPVAVPTWVTLHDLGHFDSIDAAVTDAGERGPRIHHTQAFRHTGVSTLLWAGDGSYDRERLDDSGPRHRVSMSDDGRVVSFDRRPGDSATA